MVRVQAGEKMLLHFTDAYANADGLSHLEHLLYHVLLHHLRKICYDPGRGGCQGFGFSAARSEEIIWLQ